MEVPTATGIELTDLALSARRLRPLRRAGSAQALEREVSARELARLIWEQGRLVADPPPWLAKRQRAEPADAYVLVGEDGELVLPVSYIRRSLPGRGPTPASTAPGSLSSPARAATIARPRAKRPVGAQSAPEEHDRGGDDDPAGTVANDHCAADRAACSPEAPAPEPEPQRERAPGAATPLNRDRERDPAPEQAGRGSLTRRQSWRATDRH